MTIIINSPKPSPPFTFHKTEKVLKAGDTVIFEHEGQQESVTLVGAHSGKPIAKGHILLWWADEPAK